MAVSAKAEAHGDFTRDRPHRPAGNAEKADLLNVPGVPQAVLLFGKLLGAAARAKDHADLALLRERHLHRIETRILQSLSRGCDCQRHDARHMLALTRIYPG